MQPTFFPHHTADLTLEEFKAYAVLKDQSKLFRKLMYDDAPDVIQEIYNDSPLAFELFEGNMECGLHALHTLIAYYNADIIRHQDWLKATPHKALRTFLCERIDTFEKDLNTLYATYDRLLQQPQWYLIPDWMQPLLVSEGQTIVKTNHCYFWGTGEHVDNVLTKIFITHFKNSSYEVTYQ